MKISIAVAVLSLVASQALAAPGARLYEKSVAPFDPSPNVLPKKWPNAWIKDVPEANGNRVTMGAGNMSNDFYVRLYPWLRVWAVSRQTLDFEAVSFQETVQDMSASLKQRIDATSSDKLSKFNGVEIMKHLDAYTNARKEETTKGMAVHTALKRADAAVDDVRQNEELVAAMNVAERKAEAVAQKNAYLKEIAESKRVQEMFTKALGTAVDIVGIIKNPAEGAGKAFGMVTGAIIGAAINDHQQELMVLDLQIEALDKAIENHKRGAQEAGLAKARKLLEAASTEFVQRMLEKQQVIEKQTQAIAQLGMLEKQERLKNNPLVTDVFVDLRMVNEQFLHAGRDLRRRCGTYQMLMDFGPGRRAKDYVPYLSKAITDVSNQSSPDQDWLTIARGSRDYMEKHAAWSEVERKYVSGQMRALLDRVEVLPIDDAVAQLQAKLK